MPFTSSRSIIGANFTTVHLRDPFSSVHTVLVQILQSVWRQSNSNPSCSAVCKIVNRKLWCVTESD